MNFSPDTWQLAVAIISFAGGIASSAVAMYLRRRLNKATASGPLTVQVKGSKEPIVIPEHYNAEAVDKLLHQLQIN
jgi:hypothetical protein